MRRFLTPFWVSALSMVLVSSCRIDGDRSDAARAIHSAFSASCGSVGSWTSLASTQTSALRDLFLYMQQTDACKSVSTELSGLASASQSLDSLIRESEFLSVRAAEEKINQIHLTLAGLTGTDPTSLALKNALSQSLISAQLSLYESRATYDAWKSPVAGGASASAMKAMHAQLATILQASRGPLAECLKQSPLASMQLGVSTIGLAGTFISPAVGAATQLAALMINTGLETARRSKIVDQLWSLYQSEMPTSLSCALESMTQLYCTIDDTEALLEVIGDIAVEPGPGNEPRLPLNVALRAIELVNRQLPSLTRWLEMLRAGGTANDPFDAQRRNSAWERLVKLEQEKNTYGGQARDAEARSSSAVDPSVLYKNLVYSLTAQHFSKQSVYSGLADSFFKMGCYLMDGYGAECKYADPPPAEQQANFEQAFKNWLDRNFAEKIGSYQWIYDGLASIHAQATVQIGREFSRVIIRNPRLILSGAYLGSAAELSPARVLAEVSDYLGEIEKSLHLYKNPQLESQLKQLKRRIDRSTEILAEKIPPGASDSEQQRLALEKVMELGRIFTVAEGSQSTIQEIRQIFRIDLLVRVQLPENQGGLPKDVAQILKASAMEMDARLTQVSPDRDEANLRLDASRGKNRTEENLRVFREAFSPYFERSVLALKAASIGEPPAGLRDRPNSQILAHFCLQILATNRGEYPTPKIAEACAGARLESPFYKSNPGLSADVARARLEIKAASRAGQLCWYHRQYVRKNRLSRVIPTILPPGPLLLGEQTQDAPWGDRLFPL